MLKIFTRTPHKLTQAQVKTKNWNSYSSRGIKLAVGQCDCTKTLKRRVDGWFYKRVVIIQQIKTWER